MSYEDRFVGTQEEVVTRAEYRKARVSLGQYLLEDAEGILSLGDLSVNVKSIAKALRPIIIFEGTPKTIFYPQENYFSEEGEKVEAEGYRQDAVERYFLEGGSFFCDLHRGRIRFSKRNIEGRPEYALTLLAYGGITKGTPLEDVGAADWRDFENGTVNQGIFDRQVYYPSENPTDLGVLRSYFTVLKDAATDLLRFT
jgi:hypothetical protein